MIRTWNVVRFCAKTASSTVQCRREFSVVRSVQQRLSSALLVPRGSRTVDSSAASESSVLDATEELAAEDELLNNQRNIPNLKVRQLLKDVPKKKFQHDKVPHNENRKIPKPAHKQTDIEKDTLRIVQHRYQDPCASEDRFDKNLKLRYTLLQSNDDRYRDLQSLMGSRKKREREKLLVLEGRRLIMDGYGAGLRLEAIVTSDLKLLAELTWKPKPKNCPTFLVNRQTMLEWSSLTTSPGLIGVFAEPPNLTDLITRNAQGSKRLPVTVVCDNIREPNNLGSVIRSCAAVSVQEVILLKGCAHPWDLKCLRGGAGAHFRVPVHGPLEPYQLPEYSRAGSIYVIADNKKPNDERHGFRWRHYDQIDYGNAEHVVLVIGGETYGVSDDTRTLVHELTQTENKQMTDQAFVAHIPLSNGVESLNTASALSVLLYEMRRSLVHLRQDDKETN
ncbi:rRNA methyltransferase 3, mitochondrial [Anopheles nili]|uniref:rRNA methyltransferase 3, mitochondrial n=1 Tax=Anopheles nili TaxID=185578 RepID=UPI00237A88E9|nr:rRNA methyltransferase 3, mitochondrial [Anopheles nili]